MLPRDVISRSWRPLIKTLCFPTTAKLVASMATPVSHNKSPAPIASASSSASALFSFSSATSTPIQPLPVVLPVINCPSPMLEAPEQEDKSAGGTGAPQQRGAKKRHRYLQRDPGVRRADTLELARIRRGPPTPSFPDGVPFERIRKRIHLAGLAGKVHTPGRKHKMYFSLKRGR